LLTAGATASQIRVEQLDDDDGAECRKESPTHPLRGLNIYRNTVVMLRPTMGLEIFFSNVPAEKGF
jgi:hypothetical protein